MVSLLVGKKHVETAGDGEVPGVIGWAAAGERSEDKPTEEGKPAEKKPHGLWGGVWGMGYSGSPTPPIEQVAQGELPTNSPLGAVPRGVVNTFF